MRSDNVSSLYIHIPFCVKKCAYCDFLSFASSDFREEYMTVLCREIQNIGLEMGTDARTVLKTIFIGGGTPSVLTIDEINMLGSSLNNTFDLSQLEEFTIEANPESIEYNKVKVWRAIGVNRVSMGVQSTDETLLKILGRVHNWDMAKRAYHMLRDAGVDNINMDIMFSLPEQRLDQIKKTMDDIITLNPEHISAYSLIIEQGTKFYQLYEKNMLLLPDEDMDRYMYHWLIDRLESAGYRQYEISNFARQSTSGKYMYCKHNLVYWNTESYYGVGLGASSYINGRRMVNYTDFYQYKSAVNNDKTPIKSYENIGVEEEQFEMIMLGLRLNSGVDLFKFKEKFGFFPKQKWSKIIQKWIDDGGLIYGRSDNKDYLRLTEYGRDIANMIIMDFM